MIVFKEKHPKGYFILLHCIPHSVLASLLRNPTLNRLQPHDGPLGPKFAQPGGVRGGRRGQVKGPDVGARGAATGTRQGVPRHRYKSHDLNTKSRALTEWLHQRANTKAVKENACFYFHHLCLHHNYNVNQHLPFLSLL